MEERVSSFDPEGPLMEKLSIVADLLFLNLIVFLCCIPVITAGAAMTGMHYVLIKMIRREESYVLTDFFYSFRKNFRQATVIWCLYLLFAAVLALDLYLRIDGKDVYKNEDMVLYPDIWAKIHEKLADYGFILRYLEGKEAITGYNYEPWHFRYLDDVKIAKEITSKGITLEEYLNKLPKGDVAPPKD